MVTIRWIKRHKEIKKIKNGVEWNRERLGTETWVINFFQILEILKNIKIRYGSTKHIEDDVNIIMDHKEGVKDPFANRKLEKQLVM